MRQFALILTLLLSGLALASPAHATTSGVKVVGCTSALDPAAREAVFEGRMRVRKGAWKMQMRFTLQARFPGDPTWHKLSAPGFGRWLTSNPGVGRYVYTKRVVSLEAPASYRTIVRFRWLRADGRRVASGRSTSPTCRQLDLRPNLLPLGIEAQPGADAAHARYVVPVENRGRTAAGPFDVVVSVDGTTLTPAEAPELAAGESALVEVEGPPC